MSNNKFECEVMDWRFFYSLSKKVAKKIIDSNYKPDFIVGLARGGWVLSRVLCDLLGVKDLVSLKVEHWGITATPDGKARLKYPFYLDLTGRLVLIVDDITDTGESMSISTEHVKKMNPMDVRSATLRHIKGSKFIPDYFGDEIDWRWVIFPWNFTEDLCNLVNKVTSNQEDLDTIKQRLKNNFQINIDEKRLLEIIIEIKRREEN